MGFTEKQVRGQHIKGLRERKFLSQEDVAQRAGISTRTVQAIEAGQRPRRETAEKLAKALAVTIDDLNPEEVAA